jgi:flagellar L-ring protein precursor FlgH
MGQALNKLKVNRLLSKLAEDSKMLGDLGAENRSLFNIHGGSSTKSTQQVATRVEFRKMSNNMRNSSYLTIWAIFLLFVLMLLSGCSETVDRLKRIGKAPALASVDLPSTEPDPADILVSQALQDEHRQRIKKTNSLWQPGSTTFFRDSRAWKIGDLITVNVQISDNASLNNSTQQKRNGTDAMGIPSLFGKQKAIATILSGNASASSLINTTNSRAHAGSGVISRKETINTTIAATVTKILPNGNLVIQGHQEVRVNYELREIKLAGIIRPKDIASDNSIKSSQLAEARISYGGRGIVSDVQQPRVGSQVIDAISPF